jgi:hypothetical protein
VHGPRPRRSQARHRRRARAVPPEGPPAQYLVEDGREQRTRIRVTVPSTVALSLVPTAPTFTVQVPPNGCAGQMMQVQVPNGVTVQVQIPPGSANHQCPG